jgi:anthranilate/para-aminobenzoate synthase component II
MDSPFTAARYHSLVIEEETFPHDALEATAWTEDGLIMAARHKKYKHIQVFFPLPNASRALQLMLTLALQARLT